MYKKRSMAMCRSVASCTNDKNKNAVLLDKRVIVTGDQIVDASSGMDQDGRPAVFISLNGVGAAKMGKLTQANVGKPMAVVFIEKQGRDQGCRRPKSTP